MRTPATPPVILFPMHGCEAVGMLNETQAKKRAAVLRETIRSHWNSAGVKALVELIEQRTARTQREAVQRTSGAHEQGQAYALGELLTVLHGILVSVENQSPGG